MFLMEKVWAASGYLSYINLDDENIWINALLKRKKNGTHYFSIKLSIWDEKISFNQFSWLDSLTKLIKSLEVWGKSYSRLYLHLFDGWGKENASNNFSKWNRNKQTKKICFRIFWCFQWYLHVKWILISNILLNSHHFQTSW